MKLKVIYETRGKAREYAPLGLSIYKGCDFGCTYCSVPKTKNVDKELFKTDVTVFKNDFLAKLESDCVKLAGTDKDVLLSFTSDCYNNLNEKVGLTRDALAILRKYAIPFTVLTKGGLRACADFDLYKAGVDAYAVTLTFLDEKKGRAFEPEAASPSERIASLKMAKMKGIKTWVSLEPVIDPVETLAVIKEVAPFTDLFKIGKINYEEELENAVDWAKFVVDVEELLATVGNAYILKEGLLAYKMKVEGTTC